MKPTTEKRVVVSDLGYLHFPEEYSLFERKRRDYKNRKLFRNATSIISISESIRKDLIEHYGIENERIEVEYPEISSAFLTPPNQTELERLKQRYGITGRYLLNFGELNKINNQKITVEALNNISPDISVVLIGKDSNGYGRELEKFARHKGVEHRVIFINEIFDEELAILTKGAEIVLSISKYEGFPLHLLSALAAGCVVIASSGGSHEEVGGPDQYYIDATDCNELISAIHCLLHDQRSAEMMAEAGKSFVTSKFHLDEHDEDSEIFTLES